VSKLRLLLGVTSLTALFVLGFPVEKARAAEFERECFEKSCQLFLTGEISKGDVAALKAEIARSSLPITAISLRSPGGDPFEALELSDLMNKYYIFAMADTAGLCGPSRDFACQPCASACALIFMTANMRLGNMVYIHRPSFPKEIFATLSATETEAAYNRATDKLLEMLRERRVADADIQRVMSIPSDITVPLRSDYGEYSPWLEEWLRAKCPLKPTAKPEDVVGEILFGQTECELEEIQAEAVSAQAVLKGRVR
jgi:hypothetical protein